MSKLNALGISKYRVIRAHDWMKANDSKMVALGEYPIFNSFGGDPSKSTWVAYEGGPWLFGEGGMPLSLIIHLCNAASASPWVNIPHTADFHLMQSIINGAASLSHNRPIFELSNEPWNSQFQQYHWYADKQMDDSEYAAVLRAYCVDVIRMVERVAGRGMIVLNSQFGNPWTTNYMLERLQMSPYIDAIAVAPYLGQHIEPNSAETIEQLHEMLMTQLDTQTSQQMADHAAACERYNVQMFAYESGLHLHGKNPADTELYAEYNRSEYAGELLAEMFSMWNDAGGGIYLPYSLVGPFSSTFFPHVELQGDSMKQLPKLTSVIKAGQLGLI